MNREYSFREHKVESPEFPNIPSQDFSTAFALPNQTLKKKNNSTHEIRNSIVKNQNRLSARDILIKESKHKAKAERKIEQKQNMIKNEEDLVRILLEIKKVGKQIPNFQNHVRSILLEEKKNREEKSKARISLGQKNQNLQNSNFQKENKQRKKHQRFISQLDICSLKSKHKINQEKKQELDFEVIETKSINRSNKKEKESSLNKLNSVQFDECTQKNKKSAKKHQKTVEEVDDKIFKIQSRIKEFEEKKKLLNIEFTPKQQRQSFPISDFSHEYQEQLLIGETLEKSYRNSNKKNSISASKPPRYQIKSNQSKQNLDQSPKFQKNSVINTFQYGQEIGSIKKKKLTNISMNYPQIDLSSVKYFGKSTEIEKCHTKNKQKSKGEKSFQMTEKNDHQLEKIIMALNQQIKLDESFRNDKLWLQNSKRDKKWERVQTQLELQDIRMSLEQISNEFYVTEEEHNPFFSVKENGSDIDHVVASYLKARRHWVNQIKNKFSKTKLEAFGFSLPNIDLQKKGHIIIEDLVRLLNLKTGTFFRNRDLALIFRRLTKGEKLTFQKFISTLCY